MFNIVLKLKTNYFMKQLISIVAIIIVFASCANNESKTEHTSIRPIPVEIDLSSLKDTTIMAEFSAKDYNAEDSSLTLTVYSINLYDSLAVNNIQVGDSIYSNDRVIVVDSIDKRYVNSYYRAIKIYYSWSCFFAEKGEQYRFCIECMDNYQVKEIGEVKLPVSSNLTYVYTDFEKVGDGEEYQQKSDTIQVNPKKWIEKTKEVFDCRSTRVKIKNGVITEITYQPH